MQRTHGNSFGLVAMALLAINAALPSIPARATDVNDTLHIVFSTAETGFDPQALSDNYSWTVASSIFDAPYKYDYFARPLRLVPNTASAVPEITDGGRTYTLRIRPGAYFADDPVFKSRRRELTAEDYVFSYKRILDPKVRSPYLYLFENRLQGLADVLSRARKDGQLDYRARIAGLEALDAPGDTFYAILYGGNVGAFNHARFRLPDYDHGYVESRRLPDGPARFAEFKRMDALVEAYAPLMSQSHRLRNLLVQPWLKGYKANPFAEENWAYYAIERP